MAVLVFRRSYAVDRAMQGPMQVGHMIWVVHKFVLLVLAHGGNHHQWVGRFHCQVSMQTRDRGVSNDTVSQVTWQSHTSSLPGSMQGMSLSTKACQGCLHVILRDIDSAVTWD